MYITYESYKCVRQEDSTSEIFLKYQDIYNDNYSPSNISTTKNDYHLNNVEGSSCFSPPSPPAFIATPTETTLIQKAEFRPTWLVRISDMQVVPGSTFCGPYYALSYSRAQAENQELFYTQQQQQQQQQQIHEQHVIVTDPPMRIDSISGLNTLRKKLMVFDQLNREEYQYNNDNEQLQQQQQQHNVSFKELIQQIGKDFNIEYIWFDQMCIDQTNPDEKVQEIRLRHKIYGNAFATLALIPELVDDQGEGDGTFEGKNNTKYSKRERIAISNTDWGRDIWTLQEAFTSQQILFVGRNVHFWSRDIKSRLYSNTCQQSSSLIYNLCARPATNSIIKSGWSASTILFHARTRLCSKLVPQDRIFALANIYPVIMEQGMPLGYKQSMDDLSIWFYGRLAIMDLSILLFGVPSNELINDLYERLEFKSLASSTTDYANSHFTKVNKENTGSMPPWLYSQSSLPSWTGNSYSDVIHIQSWRRGKLCPASTTAINKCSVNGRLLQITSTYAHISIIDHDPNNNNRPRKPISDIINNKDQLPQTNKDNDSDTMIYNNPTIVTPHNQHSLLFMPISNESATRSTKKAINTSSRADDNQDPLGYYGLKTTHILPVQPKENPHNLNKRKMTWINTSLSLQKQEEKGKEDNSDVVIGAWLSLTTATKDSFPEECVVLLDLSYNIGKGTEHAVMPVIGKIKKDEPYYKAIGVCIVEKLIEFIEYHPEDGTPFIVKKEMKFNHSSFVQNEQEFIIQ